MPAVGIACRVCTDVRSAPLDVVGLNGGVGGLRLRQMMLNNTNSRLTLRLLMSYIYGAPSKARNANVVYIWTYVWQR